MEKISVNFKNTVGKVKPLHATNNGPVHKFNADQRISNIDSWKAAGIPYARTHDSSFCSQYGGEHTVDVNNIFTNFDADPYDPASYDFTVTDEYLRVIDFAGTKTFYRLGAHIEHWVKKYNTLPPKDFKKWAVICEHIIRHYTEGWADGFTYDLKYWEIWNEPDLDDDDSTHKKTWGGTKAQFFDLYEIAAKHLKECFPHLKIGGPALAWREDWGKDFLTEMKKRNVPMDFFSWHIYCNDPKSIAAKCVRIRNMMDECGYKDAESILNEWNYVKGWEGDNYIYSMKSIQGLKGSSFVAGAMCVCQYVPLDMLMYYDARPCGFNGMFRPYIASECLKGYYPFKMFNELYKLDEAAEILCESDTLYACAAKSEDRAAIMLTYFDDNDNAEAKKVKVEMQSFDCQGDVKAEYYLLDGDKDLELVKEEVFSGKSFSSVLDMPLFNSCLIILSKIDQEA